jgi:hypothetical protein
LGVQDYGFMVVLYVQFCITAILQSLPATVVKKYSECVQILFRVQIMASNSFSRRK